MRYSPAFREPCGESGLSCYRTEEESRSLQAVIMLLGRIAMLERPGGRCTLSEPSTEETQRSDHASNHASESVRQVDRYTEE